MLIEIKNQPKSIIKNIPSKPGTYRMLDSGEKVLYVGKAKNLKKRIPSYFNKNEAHSKTRLLMSNVASLDLTVTNTENEALILEYSLIKRYRPKYNVVLRDDKSYPYIYVSSHQDFPRIEFQRKNKVQKGEYFGPYPNVMAVRETLTELQKIFRVRQCKDSYFRNRSRPCLQYQIKRCSAPCVSLIKKNEYTQDVRSTISFLRGKNTSIISELIKKMDLQSDQQNYEEALRYRDQIKRLKEIQAKQLAISNKKYDMDVIGIATNGIVHCVTVLFIRDGSILGSKNHFPKIKNCEDKEIIQEGFILQHYFEIEPPSEIILSEEIYNKKWIENSLKTKYRKKIKLNNNVRGNRLEWQELANKNARSGLEYKLSVDSSIEIKLKSLGKLILNGRVPKRMECVDVSHISGEATVASCVVFDKNGPLKSDYRRYNIKTTQIGDDYAAMAEAILRRYKKIKNKDEKKPDILFIDGGKGQLSKVNEILKSLEINDLSVAAIAKGKERKSGDETIYLDNSKNILKVSSHSPAFHYIQQIRDEAHRFAVTGHRIRRKINRKSSKLDGIEGLGSVKKRELLKQFGGIQGVLIASVDDLRKVKGISKDLAVRISNNLHN